MNEKKVRMIAVLGVFAAISTVLVVLGTFISINTFFFTAMASFLVGIIVVRYGAGWGTAFFVVCLLLDFLINPNKLHAFLYMGFGAFILVSEVSFILLSKKMDCKSGKGRWIHTAVRFLCFCAIYYPLVVFLPSLLVSEKIMAYSWFYPVAFGISIPAFIVFDLAYMAAKSVFYDRLGGIFT